MGPKSLFGSGPETCRTNLDELVKKKGESMDAKGDLLLANSLLFLVCHLV